jgi:NAD(P)-dependent dehydrogenase (short-subunit alcohol dehydrogenase family)
MKPTVLVTGASSGIGRATAKLLAGCGYRVFGTSRNPHHAEGIPGVTILPVDVRSDESVKELVETVRSQAGAIDVLVNNAGYALGGALEETPLEAAKAQFETNYFGVVRMVNAVLPLMRGSRHGHIVNVSSLVGRAAIPFLGHYSASKHALEAYSEALSHELKPFDIHVSLVEPGFTRTGLEAHGEYSAQPIPDYEPWRRQMLASVKDSVEAAQQPLEVARTIVRAIESRKPKLRYVVGRDARLVLALRSSLPYSWFAQGMRRRFRLDAGAERDLLKTSHVKNGVRNLT